METLRLVPYRPEHGRALFRFRQQAASLRHNPLAALPFEEFDGRMRIEGHDLAHQQDFESYRWVIELEGVPAGSVSLKNVHWTFGTGELGYGVDEARQGRGVGTEAVRQAVDLIFRETTLRRLFALVHDENAASLRLLAKLGFQREGVLREHFVIDGRPVNEVVLAVLRREWPATARPLVD